MDSTLDITLVGKLKNAALWRAANKAGSATKLARMLGLELGLVCRWINMSSVPSFKPGSVLGRADVRDRVERVLYELTGETLDEIFPEAIRGKSFEAEHRRVEITRPVQIDRLVAGSGTQICLPSAMEVASENEITDAVRATLKKWIGKLPEREQVVLKLRFGLPNGREHTYEECTHVLKVTKERVRQIEARAMRKLQHLAAMDRHDDTLSVIREERCFPIVPPGSVQDTNPTPHDV